MEILIGHFVHIVLWDNHAIRGKLLALNAAGVLLVDADRQDGPVFLPMHRIRVLYDESA